MKWDSEKNIERLRAMLESGKDKLLVYHHDADGICSAAIILKFYPGIKHMPLEGPRLDSKTMSRIASHGADSIVFVDLPVDQEYDRIMHLKKKADVAVIDHHIADRDLGRSGILHINPKMEKDVYMPASFMSYKLMEKLGKDTRPFRWISCIGIYGDYGMKDCAQFIKSSRISSEEMKMGADLLSSAVTVSGLRGAARALKHLLGAADFTDFVRSNELKAWRSEVRKEFGEIMGRFDGGKELYPEAGLVVYEVKSRLNLTSAVSNRLSEMLPDFVIMIKKKSGSEWKISLRCQSGRVNLGMLVKKCSSGIGSGGGHPKAAGTLVSDYDKFFTRLRAALSSQ